jgi:hypothetical protein
MRGAGICGKRPGAAQGTAAWTDRYLAGAGWADT